KDPMSRQVPDPWVTISFPWLTPVPSGSRDKHFFCGRIPPGRRFHKKGRRGCTFLKSHGSHPHRFPRGLSHQYPSFASTPPATQSTPIHPLSAQFPSLSQISPPGNKKNQFLLHHTVSTSQPGIPSFQQKLALIC